MFTNREQQKNKRDCHLTKEEGNDETERDLVVDKKKEILRDTLDFVVDRTENGGDSAFYGSNSRSQRS